MWTMAQHARLAVAAALGIAALLTAGPAHSDPPPTPTPPTETESPAPAPPQWPPCGLGGECFPGGLPPGWY